MTNVDRPPQFAFRAVCGTCGWATTFVKASGPLGSSADIPIFEGAHALDSPKCPQNNKERLELTIETVRVK